MLGARAVAHPTLARSTRSSLSPRVLSGVRAFTEALLIALVGVVAVLVALFAYTCCDRRRHSTRSHRRSTPTATSSPSGAALRTPPSPRTGTLVVTDSGCGAQAVSVVDMSDPPPTPARSSDWTLTPNWDGIVWHSNDFYDSGGEANKHHRLRWNPTEHRRNHRCLERPSSGAGSAPACGFRPA
jgi:hypothetical protein